MLFSARVGGVQGLGRASGPPPLPKWHHAHVKLVLSMRLEHGQAHLAAKPLLSLVSGKPTLAGLLIPVSLEQGQLCAFCGSRTSLRIICKVVSNCRGS